MSKDTNKKLNQVKDNLSMYQNYENFIEFLNAYDCNDLDFGYTDRLCRK